MTNPKIVSREAWLDARKALLAEEKAFNKKRDELAAKRRSLGMVKIEKPYRFDDATTKGKVTLLDLFEGKRQLIVYHFMLGPGWEAGCKSCSYVTDHLIPTLPHLRARDTSLVAISHAPINEIEAFKKRMGWTDLRWVSAFNNDFNFDFHVSFPEHKPEDLVTYNFRQQTFGTTEGPGLSTFLRGDDNDKESVFHAYSTYARGLDPLINTYNLLDLTALGRQEEDLPFSMAWVKHHDRYE
jgi:predicted dithiol-disulfide oxidoreductase (DUF899 family)